MADISLEIHHLDVRGGDATAVIVKRHTRDRNMETGKDEDSDEVEYRMLIDAGAESGGSAALKAHLQTFFPGTFDLVIATHYHQDHIQGFHQANVNFKNFLDNGAYRDATGTFEPVNDIGKGARSKIFRAYGSRTQEGLFDDPDTPGRKLQPKRLEIPFIKAGFAEAGGEAAPLVIPLGTTGMTLTCYCANGILANGRNVLQEQKKVRRKAINPNDVSLAFVLEWGNFRYLTAGDLSGATTSTNYYNIEKELVDYLIQGPLKDKTISVFKASHHGSEHSNQPYLFEKLKPETVVVSCNLQKRVPSPVFLQRLKKHFDRETKGAVVFTNTLKVFRNTDLYTELESLKSFIAEGNVSFPKELKPGKRITTAQAKQAATNLAIKTALIRRRVADGKYVSTAPIPAGASRKDMKEYEIILTKRDAKDAKAADTLKFKDYDFRGTWAKYLCGRQNIERGFNEQSAEMIRWLKADATPDERSTDRTIGADYIRKHYPALVPISDDFKEKDKPKYYEDKERRLNEKMLALFDNAFVEYTATDGVLSYRWNKDNTLSQDDKFTIYNLLQENFHQLLFSRAYPVLHAFEKEQCWNYDEAPEPYFQKVRAKKRDKRELDNHNGVTERTDTKRKKKSDPR